MKEIWKLIPGLRCYEASDLGHIRRVGTTKPLKGSCDKEGYVQVRLSENNIQFTKKAHRLVALTFLENPNNYPMVNHKNEIKDDNRVENLEWCTAKYNSHYSAKKTYHDSIIHRMKPVVQYDLNLNKIGEFESTRAASKALHLNNGHIGNCCNGIYKTCGGFIFKWKSDDTKPIKVVSMMNLKIKTKRICYGFYVLQHKDYYVVIQKVGRNKWQAHLPSGGFANATSKNDCVLKAMDEIDATESLECDNVAKSPDWWKYSIEFNGIEKSIYPKLLNRKNNFRKDIDTKEIIMMKLSGKTIKEIANYFGVSHGCIEKRCKKHIEDEPVELK